MAKTATNELERRLAHLEGKLGVPDEPKREDIERRIAELWALAAEANEAGAALHAARTTAQDFARETERILREREQEWRELNHKAAVAAADIEKRQRAEIEASLLEWEHRQLLGLDMTWTP